MIGRRFTLMYPFVLFDLFITYMLFSQFKKKYIVKSCITGYKMKIHEAIKFLYTNNEQSKNN
jgi:hypothetical protein